VKVNFFRLRERVSVQNRDGDLVDIFLSKGCIDYIESLMSVGLDANYLTQLCDCARGETDLDVFIGFVAQRIMRQQKRELVDIANKRALDSTNVEHRIWRRSIDDAIQAAVVYFGKSGPKAE
jgi:hypothetical protein